MRQPLPQHGLKVHLLLRIDQHRLWRESPGLGHSLRHVSAPWQSGLPGLVTKAKLAFCKKSSIYLYCKSMNPHRCGTFPFRSFQQLNSSRLQTLEGFFEPTWRPLRALYLACMLLLELPRNMDNVSCIAICVRVQALDSTDTFKNNDANLESVRVKIYFLRCIPCL